MATVAGMASYLDAATIVSSGNALVMYQEPLGLSGDQIGVLASALTLSIAPVQRWAAGSATGSAANLSSASP